MVLPRGAVATHYQPQVINRKTSIPQRDVFGDRVVLTIAFRNRRWGSLFL
jgi:hypothetical protein